jgi:hypothetical protein
LYLAVVLTDFHQAGDMKFYAPLRSRWPECRNQHTSRYRRLVKSTDYRISSQPQCTQK